jgi:hypothetical protein
MENHHFQWVNPRLMAIFNSYSVFSLDEPGPEVWPRPTLAAPKFHGATLPTTWPGLPIADLADRPGLDGHFTCEMKK